MFKSISDILETLPIKAPTDSRWATLAVQNVGVFLSDHASCERKAHAAAMMLVSKYPEYPELQDRMIALAREELLHFQQVVDLMRARGLALGTDDVNPYVKQLMTQVRHPKEEHLLDRLLVASIIEARSCERFCLFTNLLPEGELRLFYENFAREESAHAPLFLETAKLYFASDIVESRYFELLTFEAKIIPTLPLRPTVH